MLEVLVCNERLQSSPEQEKKYHQYSSFPSESLVHVDDMGIRFSKVIGNQHPRERGERERERERERDQALTFTTP
jgi:hypothetical protein